jgi:hypothetical protein
VIVIDLGTIEYYDSWKNQFIHEDGGIVRFEYSLKAVYNWEGKWRKPFLKGDLTGEEWIDFYMSMALDPIDEKFMTYEVMKVLSNYISESQTATTFSVANESQNGNKKVRPKIHTAEELYALMFTNGIPIEFESRNLNRLSVILKIINLHNSPPKKMSKYDIYKQNAQLNAERKQQLRTKG